MQTVLSQTHLHYKNVAENSDKVYNVYKAFDEKTKLYNVYVQYGKRTAQNLNYHHKLSTYIEWEANQKFNEWVYAKKSNGYREVANSEFEVSKHYAFDFI